MHNALEKLSAADTRIFFWFSGYRMLRPVEFTSRWASRCGDGYLYGLTGLLLLLMEPLQGRHFFAAGVLAFALELPLYLLLKNTIQRDRPCHALAQIEASIKPSDRFSFPSGHAAAAFLFATVISAFYPQATVIVYLLAGIVGLSRVLLGVHYPADILAGALLGYVSAELVLVFLGH